MKILLPFKILNLRCIILLTNSLFVISCTSNYYYDHAVQTSLPLEWIFPLDYNHAHPGLDFNPVFIKNDVLFSYEKVGSRHFLFLTKDGNNPVRDSSVNISPIHYQCQAGNGDLIIHDYAQIFSIRSRTEIVKLKSKPDIAYFEPTSTLIGDFIYISGRDKNNVDHYVYKYNVYTGTELLDKKINLIDYPDLKDVNCYSPTYYITSNNDTLLNYNLIKLDFNDLRKTEG